MPLKPAASAPSAPLIPADGFFGLEKNVIDFLVAAKISEWKGS